MLETLSNCPLCDRGRINKKLIVKDHTVSNESFSIFECKKCQLLFTNPRPKKEDLSKFYKSEDYISHTNTSNSPINLIYKLARTFTLKIKVKLINKLSEHKSLLDYGCGTGHFLEECQKNNWTVSGVEPNSAARLIANNITKGQVVSDSKEISSKYDIITLWHVLEHVPDLQHTLQLLKSKLNNQGHLVMAVPNHKSWDAQIYGEYWAAYDVPRHLYHFNLKSMTHMAQANGLKIVGIEPMKLDAYYVSMLSQKIKNGQNNYLRAIINGYKSNSYAKNNGNNYSSLIYILKSND